MGQKGLCQVKGQLAQAVALAVLQSKGLEIKSLFPTTQQIPEWLLLISLYGTILAELEFLDFCLFSVILPCTLPTVAPLAFSLSYLFPRQLLIHYFWTPKQQVEFLNIYHGMRREAYPDIIDGLARATQFVADQQIRDPMQRLCTKVREGNFRIWPDPASQVGLQPALTAASDP